MDQHELRAQCLAMPGAGEEFPFGDEVSVFKVGGKMFAACPLDDERRQSSPAVPEGSSEKNLYPSGLLAT